ncbi:hypothetical protein Scep_030356 [Stephania cephalantha]|uniref:Cytochrome P450 n=1 Tax=Stephania cephalantha TaxID=152367 RepID=A0AAP0E2A6_9MAGN
MDFSSFNAFLLCFIMLALTTLYIFKIITKNSHQQGSLRLPPGPPRVPIFGNLLQLGPLPHRDLASFCSKYGPLVYLRLGGVDAITTDDPEIIREILFKQDDIFASRPKTVAAIHLAYGCRDVALAPLGSHWKRMRRICMEHLLSTKRLELFVNHRVDEANHLVRDVWKRIHVSKLVNLREVLGAFSMNNVTRMLLGKQYFGVGSAGPEEAMEFMNITHELFWLLGLIYLGDYLPIWRWIDPFGCEKKMRDVEKRVDKFHKKIIEEHRKVRNDQNGDEKGEMDFVDILLSLPGEDGKEHMDDVEIKALIQDMIAAATDTSAVTNEWAMAEVIKHPRVLRRIQEELDEVVGLHRMSTKPTIINGYYIPGGTRVFINTYGLGRNRRVWDNVEEFLPERHLVAVTGSGTRERVEISHGADFKILPFSAGKRKCPGAPLGVAFVLTALARLFHCFDWAPPREGINTEEVYGMTMPKAKPLVVWPRTPRLATNMYHSV